MQVRTLLPFLALLTPSLCLAQRPGMSGLGYMGGVQAATWRSEARGYRPVPGGVAGIYLPIWAGRRIEIQPDLVISLQGAAFDLPDGDRTTIHDVRLNMPVSLKFFFSRTFNLQAGVQGGYQLFAHEGKDDISSSFRKLDMGLTMGVGIGTQGGMDYTLRYYSGLSNLLAEDVSLYPSSRTLQFSVGYRFMQFSRSRQR